MDSRLVEFAATALQRERLQAWVDCGSQKEAAKQLGCDTSRLREARRAAVRRAARQGYAPDLDQIHPVPDGQIIRGVSTLYDEDGKVKAQWVKSRADDDARIERLREFLADLCGEVEGQAPAIAPPELTTDEMMTVYPMGDPHCGMYAWKGETGEDFNLEIFEARLKGAIDRLVEAAPATQQALFINLGDFFHADSSANRTPASGHALDVDTRFAKVAQVAFRSMVYAINRLREKHEHITVWNRPGNHDPHAYLMLAMSLSAYFHDDDRVDVPVEAGMFSYMRFGRCLFGSTHGHGPKLAELPMIMATDCKEDWGRTDYRTFFLGHFHHRQVIKDMTGCTIEIARTLAGSDAWHHAEGYRSLKDMQAIVYHRQFGEVERHTCGLAMIHG